MIKRFLNFFRRSARPSQSVPESQLALTRTRVGDTSLVRINVDDWEPDTQQALHALAAKHANLTFYDGKVQHGYALSHVATWTRESNPSLSRMWCTWLSMVRSER